MNTTNMFQTTNRHLENFLFMHRINFHTWFKNESGDTVWIYRITDELTNAINEYRALYPRRFVS